MQKDIWIKRMHSFSSHLEELGNFVSLNYTAFSKILKKIDKHLNAHLRDELMLIINESYFIKSPIRSQLVLDTKKVTYLPIYKIALLFFTSKKCIRNSRTIVRRMNNNYTVYL